MTALFVLGCYAAGSFLSYLLVSYVCGYRGYDDTDRGMNCVLAIIIYPLWLPAFFIFPYASRTCKYLASLGEIANKKAIARREAKEALKALAPKATWVDEPTSYRTSEKVKRFL